MKKIYLLGLSVAVTAFAFAQNREVIGQEKNWERLELSQDRSEDTLSPASMNDPCILNGFTLYTSGDGYVAGMNDYGDIGKGQLYPLNGSADVVGALVWYGAIVEGDGNTQITCEVRDGSGANAQGTSTAHGVSDIDTTAAGANGFYSYTFSSTVAVSADFMIFVNWSGGTDTVGIVSTISPCGDGAYEEWSDNSIYAFNDGSSWGLDVDLQMLPLVNNLGYTGIFDSEKEGFGVYQNGSNIHVNNISFDATVQKINLYDLQGRIVKEWSITEQWDNYTFDVSTVPAGNYILSMNTSLGNYAQKFNLK